jgi:hypothetical protein
MDPVLAIFAVLALGLVVHEGGHLAFAALGSISVQLVSIGIGPPLLRARFGKTEFEVRTFPFAGFVAPASYDDLRKPWHIAFVLGGVCGNAALIVAIALLDRSGLAAAWPQVIRDGFEPMIYFQIYSIVVNLIPHQVSIDGRLVGTDGWQLIELLRGRHTADAYRDYVGRLARYSAGGSPRTTETWPVMLRQVTRTETWSNAFARHDVLPILRRELASGTLSPEEEMLALDALITTGLVSGAPDWRLHLDAWSARAVALGPDIATLKGSRGAVLVELGQPQAGKALLESLAATAPSGSIDATMTQIYLARAEGALNNVAAAQPHLADARRAVDAIPRLAGLRPLLERSERAVAAMLPGAPPRYGL